jgi:hypothetical protein
MELPQGRALSTVHDALAHAATEQPTSEGPMGTYTFRCEREQRTRVESLCERHGTTLPAYLRKCMEMLESDYQP